MTLEEKVGQIAPERGRARLRHRSDRNLHRRKARGWCWGLVGPRFQVFTPKNSAILRNGVQRYLREKTRLGIPELFMGESLHGFMEYGSTSFPQAIGLSQYLGPALVKQVFTAAGDEARSRGAGQVFTPVLDLARDPRWGRTEETYGEDPVLWFRAWAWLPITGLQGDAFLSIGPHHVMATMKHFAVHGQPEGGTNTAPGNYSERIIRENFFVPFQAAVQEAHVGSVMASYNEIDGIPSHINHWLLGQSAAAGVGLRRLCHLRWRRPSNAGADASCGGDQSGCGAAGAGRGRGLRPFRWLGVSHADLSSQAGDRAGE